MNVGALRVFGLFLLLSALSLTACTKAQDLSGLSESATPLRDDLDAIVRGTALNGSVIVTRGGETVLAEGYGWADVEQRIRNTTQTAFRIGSVTKQFTAMAIMILQEQGHLSVDDTLGHHLDDIPSAWQLLTIHQILTQTSGLMHSWALAGFAETMHQPTTLEATIARFKDQPLLFSPGEQFSYSGLGYFILALLVERVSGQSYEVFLRTEVFEPLGMHTTGADRPNLDLSDRALGYTPAILNSRSLFIADSIATHQHPQNGGAPRPAPTTITTTHCPVETTSL